MMLADLGADILRIESLTRPDLVRMLPPRFNGGSDTHALLNTSKHSLSLNLKILRKLSKTAGAKLLMRVRVQSGQLFRMLTKGK